ncbi:MAG: tetratricopeptide repeat protein [Candidatus Binatia bacterium]
MFAGQPEKAISVIEQSIRLNPRSLFYFNALGLAQIAAGRYEEAIVPLKKLLTRNPKMMIAHMNIAICYVELGRLEEARTAGVEVMRLNPNWSLDFIRHAPWKDPAIIERHITALRKAGLK